MLAPQRFGGKSRTSQVTTCLVSMLSRYIRYGPQMTRAVVARLPTKRFFFSPPMLVCYVGFNA